MLLPLMRFVKFLRHTARQMICIYNFTMGHVNGHGVMWMGYPMSYDVDEFKLNCLALQR